MRIDKFACASFTFVALLVAACSSAPPTIQGGSGSSDPDKKTAQNGTLPGGSNPSDKGAPSPGTGGTQSPGTGGTQTPGGGGVCSAEATSDACWECCEDQNAAVSARVEQIEKAWQTCACAASKCGAACGGDYCAGAPDDDPGTDECEECLDENTDDCDEQEDAAWDALENDSIYAPVDTCAEASACDTKPEEPEDD